MNARKLFFNICAILFHIMIISAMLVGNLVFPTSAHALGLAITVNTAADNTTKDDRCSLREAITNANKNYQFYTDCTGGVSDDGIFFSNALGTATITLGSALPPIKDFVGLSINGGGDITINGGSSYQVFVVNNRVPLTLDGLTVTRGFTASNGGGLLSNGGFVTITNSTFLENRAHNGGGVYNNGGNLTITNSNFLRNFAGLNAPGDNDGGGVYQNGGVLTITNSTFSGNNVYNGTDGDGSGVYIAFGTTTITQSTFSGNGNIFSDGGGVFEASGNLTIALSTFTANIASLGGGIYVASGTGDITNSTFSGNTASQAGGVQNLGTTTIKNSTFSGNSGNAGGGIVNMGTLNLFNTIIANSISGADCFTNPDSPVTGSNNLIEADSLSSNACGTAALGVDPRLEALTTSSPAYFPLNSASPAINAGNDSICAAAPVNNASQNGVTRPQGAHCEIGSFEMPSTLVQSPQEAIVELSSDIQALVDNSVISADNGKTLTSILDGSIQALDKDDAASGIEALNSFIDEVNALVKSEEVKPTDGQLLIDNAQAIIDSINQMKN